jgi:hypothetical protein
MWVLWMVLIPCIFRGELSAGTFGDMFGALNTLFTGFAFVGVSITIWYQRQQLHAQREELDDVKATNSAQRDALKRQHERDVRLAEPTFKLEKKNDKVCSITNLGAPVTNLRVTTGNGVHELDKSDTLVGDRQFEISVSLDGEQSIWVEFTRVHDFERGIHIHRRIHRGMKWQIVRIDHDSEKMALYKHHDKTPPC